MVVPGPSYGAGTLKRAILGGGWRELWLTPVRAPLLDLDAYAGGLKVDKRGGGFQTATLHMTEKDGWKEYRFRSVDKFPMQRMPDDLEGTLVARVIQDQTGNLFPGAPVMVSPFVTAIGGLHVPADMYVIADQARLGEYRSTFAGMLGTMELKGEEAPDDKPGFAGSSKVKGTDGFFEDLDKSQAHRVNEREFLAVRLVDFLINDTDRTPDNYDWARFSTETGYLWRPISRDRDRAFTNGEGLLNKLFVRKVYPKFTQFNERYSMRGLMQSSYIFDRRLLQRLTATDFDQIARHVQTVVSDSVIEAAIAELPIEWRQQTAIADELRTTLKARRAALPGAAAEFYRRLAGEIDIRLTGDNERAHIVRHANGEVTVTVPSVPASPKIVASAEVPNQAGGATRTMGGEVGSPAQPFFQRTFLPSETREIRVYLGKGDDVAVVSGAKNEAIVVRVIGEDGADVLADSAGGSATHFYDAEGANQFITTPDTRISTKAWDAPPPTFGFNIGHPWKPDWGGSAGWAPVAKYTEGAGVALGFGPRFKTYGFRKLPHAWKAGANFLVAPNTGEMAVTADVDYRMENSPLAVTLNARASQLEAFRFYGFGNNTADIGRDLSLVEQRVLSIEPALVWHLGWRTRERTVDILQQEEDVPETEEGAEQPKGRRPMVGKLQLGPMLAWTDPDPMPGSPLATSAVYGTHNFTMAGLRFGAELDATDRDPIPTSGWRLRAGLGGYPSRLGLDGAFTTAAATGAAYLPLGGSGANLAFRLGGGVATGTFPAQFAASIGGSSSLRGYRARRFAGDAATNASTELRLPIGTLNFIVRSKVGVFGLADAGRVWFDGQSDGGWHTSTGGGLWLTALGKVVTFTYARGEQNRFYLKTGLAF